MTNAPEKIYLFENHITEASDGMYNNIEEE